MNRNRVYFYFIRFKKASVPELFHKMKEQVFIRLLKKEPFLWQNSFKAPDVPFDEIQRIKFPSIIYGNTDTEIIEGILNGDCFCLNSDYSLIQDFEEQWQKCFFSDIPTNQEEPDIRAVWEPARLQHLTIVLAQLSKASDGSDADRQKSFVRNTLITWLKKNPFLYSPHYISVMECALRIPVFLLGLKVLDTLTVADRKTILQAIFEHGWIIRKRLSLYSSLGNHTITESVGLIFAGAVFGKSKQGREWLQTGIRLLEQECCRQILDDGGPIEQSLNYHRFVLDLCMFAVDFMEQNRLHDCTELKSRLEIGEKFLSNFTTQSGLPFIGDSDDGYAIAPGLFPRRLSHTDSPPSSESEYSIQTFPDSGYTVIQNRNHILMTFDHGTLGMNPLYNHGHADALSITLHIDGKPFLTDPGTYRYNGKEKARAYFKSTRAHNTVTIDGQDQARQVTGFVWKNSYHVYWKRNISKQGYPTIRGTHDGYACLESPVYHTRQLASPKPGVYIVRDTFQGHGNHVFELNYHLDPKVRVKKEDGWTVLENSGTKIFLKLLEDEFSVIRGQQEPFLGWYSPEYGLIQETGVLQSVREGSVYDIIFTSIFCTREPEDAIKLEELI
jgi:hypothetical protein